VKRLFVWLCREDGTFALVGELATTDPAANGRFESEFEYARDWQQDSRAFSLDPASLPLQPPGMRYRATQFEPPLSVFDDALPDDWGRRLLARALKSEGRSSSLPEMLGRMAGGGTGALRFSEEPTLPESATATLATLRLATLLKAATQFEAGTLRSDDAFRTLLEGSSRVGGARPKALVHDDSGEWIAKFPSTVRDGPHDVVGLEATCLALARRAGLAVPEARIRVVGRRKVLLVRRFDVTPAGGRIHMVSMKTLCKERPGIFAHDYSTLARALEKYSASPAADVATLFKHMVFNAAIGNVDDHLKNFWMLATATGYRLAPAFDLVPDITGRGEHTLAFQYGFACPTREQLCEVARDWRVRNPTAVLDQVVDAVKKFRSIARKNGVRVTKAFEALHDDVRRRLALLAR
jgi:serine/threonine-protein kinase HipA